MIAYKILDINVCDQDEKIRTAYLKRIKQFSPEKSPEEYKTIRKAYEMIETKQKRVEYFLYGNDKEFSFKEYERIFLKIDNNITAEKWKKICRIYQESK